MQNSIFTITTYKHNGLWVFDDDSVGLTKEPFVAGADQACERLADGRPALTLVFSTVKFPGHKLTLTKVKGGPETGTDYTCKELDGMAMWLCPALNLYFPDSPEAIYVNYVPLESWP